MQYTDQIFLSGITNMKFFFKSEVLDMEFVILTTGIAGNRESEINTHFES